jgi:hypothetical protein
MKSDIVQERYLLIGENLPFKEFFNRVAKALDKPKPSVLASPFLAQIAWRIEWLKWKFTGKTPLITKDTARNAQEITHYRADKIESQLGFTFTPIEESIEHTATIFLDQKK